MGTELAQLASCYSLQIIAYSLIPNAKYIIHELPAKTIVDKSQRIGSDEEAHFGKL
jgi:hypothetical protein